MWSVVRFRSVSVSVPELMILHVWCRSLNRAAGGETHRCVGYRLGFPIPGLCIASPGTRESDKTVNSYQSTHRDCQAMLTRQPAVYLLRPGYIAPRSDVSHASREKGIFKSSRYIRLLVACCVASYPFFIPPYVSSPFSPPRLRLPIEYA